MLSVLLESWRNDKRIRQREAAKLIGVSLATYNRLENGNDFDNQTMLKIMNFLFGKESS